MDILVYFLRRKVSTFLVLLLTTIGTRGASFSLSQKRRAEESKSPEREPKRQKLERPVTQATHEYCVEQPSETHIELAQREGNFTAQETKNVEELRERQKKRTRSEADVPEERKRQNTNVYPPPLPKTEPAAFGTEVLGLLRTLITIQGRSDKRSHCDIPRN
jgi:hypothetical protein